MTLFVLMYTLATNLPNEIMCKTEVLIELGSMSTLRSTPGRLSVGGMTSMEFRHPPLQQACQNGDLFQNALLSQSRHNLGMKAGLDENVNMKDTSILMETYDVVPTAHEGCLYMRLIVKSLLYLSCYIFSWIQGHILTVECIRIRWELQSDEAF